eukprot:scaffold139408_cov27-Prasinocladus_malaysianus.AAC.1
MDGSDIDDDFTNNKLEGSTSSTKDANTVLSRHSKHARDFIMRPSVNATASPRFIAHLQKRLHYQHSEKKINE